MPSQCQQIFFAFVIQLKSYSTKLQKKMGHRFLAGYILIPNSSNSQVFRPKAQHKEHNQSNGVIKLKAKHGKLPNIHAQAQYEVLGKLGFNEQLGNTGKVNRLMESRALLNSLAEL